MRKFVHGLRYDRPDRYQFPVSKKVNKTANSIYKTAEEKQKRTGKKYRYNIHRVPCTIERRSYAASNISLPTQHKTEKCNRIVMRCCTKIKWRAIYKYVCLYGLQTWTSIVVCSSTKTRISYGFSASLTTIPSFSTIGSAIQILALPSA